MGLYFGTFFDNKLRLTIEATQMIGSRCTKNILDVTKKELDVWMQGEKLELSKLELPQQPVDPGAFVIMRYRHERFDDYVGCGKIGGDLILNYIPKTRYIHATYD
jgi:NOL1/NOP2/fmu family ribosome biogenesis protein